MPVNQYNVLRENLPDAELVFTKGFLHELLSVHSAEELDCVRKAGVLCKMCIRDSAAGELLGDRGPALREVDFDVEIFAGEKSLARRDVERPQRRLAAERAADDLVRGAGWPPEQRGADEAENNASRDFHSITGNEVPEFGTGRTQRSARAPIIERSSQKTFSSCLLYTSRCV